MKKQSLILAVLTVAVSSSHAAQSQGLADPPEIATSANSSQLLAQGRNPQTAEDYVIRGVKKDQQRDHQGAIDDYNQAIRLNPKYADAYTGRGLAKFSLNDYRGAIDDYNQAIRLDPNFDKVYVERGRSKAKESRRNNLNYLRYKS